MATFVIEIHPKTAALDPLAAQVKGELIDAGEPPKTAVVETSRLFRIEGELSPEQIDNVTATLLVDPVVETAVVTSDVPSKSKKAPKSKGGITLDVWPKPGVTDPVGETVEKGIRDLGLAAAVKTSSAQRYHFPKSSSEELIQRLAKRTLANELIHDIHVRKA